MRRTLLTVALSISAVAVTTLSGCVSRTQSFEGYGEDQVWSAMIAAARTPEYDDWKVAENELLVDESNQRLEVYRRLRRLYVSPYAEPRKEREEWRFQIKLSSDESSGSAIVEFTARQLVVPGLAWREADRYFAQVRSLLAPAQQDTEPPAEQRTDSSGSSAASATSIRSGPGSIAATGAAAFGADAAAPEIPPNR